MRVLIEGQLQGLNFRLSTQEQAERLKLAGFIRTLSDGRTEIEVQGKKTQLEKLLQWCQENPHGEYIRSILYRFDKPTDSFTEFIIRR